MGVALDRVTGYRDPIRPKQIAISRLQRANTLFAGGAIATALFISGNAAATNGYFTHGIGTHNKA
ncbi:MAG: hypothetical protein ACI8RN_001564 [Glaciecola sp.]